jgi:hypothetical protein
MCPLPTTDMSTRFRGDLPSAIAFDPPHNGEGHREPYRDKQPLDNRQIGVNEIWQTIDI